VNHHIFPDEAFVDFLRRLRVVGRRAFIFNDLERSGLCYVKTIAQTEAIRLVGGKPLQYVVEYVEALTRMIMALHPALDSVLSPLQVQLLAAARFVRIFAEGRPGTSLTLDGAVTSVER
jgi:hypothetical protein